MPIRHRRPPRHGSELFGSCARTMPPMAAPRPDSKTYESTIAALTSTLDRAATTTTDLWTANYTFLNERLARHYGIPNVAGPEYRRVTWLGPERAGLLAQGSILTLTSRAYSAYPVDIPTTSPAMRAKWIFTRFLGVNP